MVCTSSWAVAVNSASISFEESVTYSLGTETKESVRSKTASITTTKTNGMTKDCLFVFDYATVESVS